MPDSEPVRPPGRSADSGPDPATPIADIAAGIRHLLFRYYMPSGLATIGAMMLVPTLPVFLADRTGSLTSLSIILSAAAIGGLAANLPLGALVEKSGERAGFIGGIVVNAVGVFGLLLPGAAVVPFAACLVAGAGQSSRLLARQTYARRAIDVGVRGRLMSLFGGIGRVALLTGPLLGGFVGELFGLRVAFAVAGGLMLAGASVAASVGPGLSPTVTGSGNRVDKPTCGRAPRPTGYGSVWRQHRRSISLVGVGMTGAALVRVGRLTLIPLYGASIGLDLSDVGVVVAIAGGLDLVLFPVAGWLMDTYGRLYAVVPSFLLMGAGLAVLPLARSFTGVALAALGIGFGNGLGSGTMLTFSTDLAPTDGTAQFLGLIRSLSDLGRILGPLVVGVVADRLDLGASAVALALVAAATAALFGFAIGEPVARDPIAP